MEVQFVPNSVDEPNLLYKLQCKIKVFNTANTLPHRGYNLVASSSKYGFVFVGVPSGFLSVYQLQQLINKESEPLHLTVALLEEPTHISVSCDSELLAVTGKNILCVYKVTDFKKPKTFDGSTQKVQPKFSFNYDLNSPSYVTAMQWNPCIPNYIALTFYDGSLFVCQVGTGDVKKVACKARCICWSPKGKQLVTGNSDGTLYQFKPDLTPAKGIPAPNLFEGAPVEALAVYWISTFQFAVVYKNATDNSRPSVTILNTPKGGQPSCLNYEDICFSMSSNRPWYYFLHGVAQWNIILAASSNSMELATMGTTDGVNWLQWSQPDEARPELPLTDKKQENYPIGVCLDLCAIHQLTWGENEILPHMPLLHVLSQTGHLTIFNLINLSNQVPQICCVPQLLAIPAHAMTSHIPGEVPKEEEIPAPMPETKVSSALQGAQPNQLNASPVSEMKIPNFTPTAASTLAPDSVHKSALAAQLQATTAPPKPQPTTPSEPKQPPVQPLTTQQPPTQPQPTQPQPTQPQPTQPLPTQPQPTPENAALKAEQEKINKAKANQELKNILVKEVNDFQNDLYNFMLKTRETQARIQRDIESINSNFSFNSLDTEQLKKECSIDELRNAVVQLKLELVRACAVIAEARTHSNAREFHKWNQADPLTTKRVASVEKLAYYVQTQLDQAQEALAYKWNKAREHESNGPGKRMIRPILDDVYQPLVKQQEILSRQQAVLRTLRKTLNECDVGPVFKSSSLLRHTPFRNKDPLSKLTKNILNMSIEPQNVKLAKGLLTVQKLEALKDALSNRKTVKIKPVNVELRQHFVTMKEKYDRILKEKMAQANVVADKEAAFKPDVQTQVPDKKNLVPSMQPPKYKETAPSNQQVYKEPKIEMQESVKHSASAPSFTPVGNSKPMPVVRTLFTDEPKQELPTKQQAKPFTYTQGATLNASSVLKNLLQTKSQANLAGLDAKNDADNLFLGQKICSPTVISRSSASMSAMMPSPVFTSKPISDMNNMFTKLPTSTEPPTSKPAPTVIEKQPALTVTETQPPSFKPAPTFAQSQQPKPSFEPKIHSETGEPDSTDPPKEFKTNKPMTNLFGMKPTATITPVPDVLKTSNIPVTVKPVERQEKSKENVPKSDEAKEQKTDKKELTPLGVQTANKGPVFGSENNSSPSNESRPLDLKSEIKPTNENTDKVHTVQPKVTSAAAAPIQSVFGTPLSTTPKESTPPEESTPSNEFAAPNESTPKSEPEMAAESKSPAASIFGAAVASQPKIESLFSSQSSSIFATTNAPTVFGAKSVVGSNSLPTFGATSTTQSSNAASVFTSASEPASFGSVAADDLSSAFTKTDPETPTTSASTSTPSSVFASIPAFGTTGVTSSSSVFSNTPSSVFGQATGAFAPTTTSMFTATTATTFSGSVFGTTTQASSVFDSTSTPASVFGTAASQAFGNAPPTTQTGSIFGAPTSQAPVFGATAPTQSVFGTTQTTQASLFGTPTQTSQASVFGTQIHTTQASVFGSPTQTTQASVFGTPTQTTQASVFGTPTQTTQASVFGTPTQTTQASVFGTPTQTTQASVFGTPTQTTQASVFGTPTQTTQASIFGTPNQTTQASIFGTPNQTSQPSVFGGSTVNSGGSLFGGGESNLFAAASISPTNAPTATGGNIFGGSSTGSVFGGGANVFGKTAFGQSNNTAASVFGGASSFGQQKPANSLWTGGNSTGGFGSSGFGQQPTQAPSIFGGGAGNFSAPSAGAFGSSQQTPAFGTGESQPSSVFGSPQQQSAPGFGGSPVFGSKPAFGQSTGFGSPTSGGGGFGSFGSGFNKSPSGFGAPAAFGSGATFGGNAFGNTSPGKAFGGTAPSFGSPAQQSNATFENLATQNTLTFGSLAQSPQQQQQPSFNTSPSFTGWRG